MQRDKAGGGDPRKSMAMLLLEWDEGSVERNEWVQESFGGICLMVKTKWRC